MLKKSFWLFFIAPILKIFGVLKNYILFVFKLFKELLLLKVEPKNDADTLAESLKIFRIIVAIIIFNFSYKEIYNGIDSNFLSELFAELLMALNYFIFFIIAFYIGLVSDKIYKSTTLSSLSAKLWSRYALLFIVLLAFFDGLSGNVEKRINVFLSLLFFSIIYLLVFYFYLIKTKIFRKSHIIYILIISVILECGIFFLMAFQDFLNQLPNNIPN